MSVPLRVVGSWLLLAFVANSVLAADENAVKALVAEAEKAAAEVATTKPPHEMWQIWHQLANARVGIGDIAGGIEALDRFNKDHDVNLCDVWILQIAAVGKLTPEPTVK